MKINVNIPQEKGRISEGKYGSVIKVEYQAKINLEVTSDLGQESLHSLTFRSNNYITRRVRGLIFIRLGGRGKKTK